MKAEEIRCRLISELEAQFSGKDVSLTTPEEPVITFPSPSFEKPKMFETKTSPSLEFHVDSTIPVVKGIGFKNKRTDSSIAVEENKEIYSMKELIDSNLENMQTFSYDEKVVKTQLALVKKRDWQDILFDDVDWFMKIDIISGIKRLFGKY